MAGTEFKVQVDTLHAEALFVRLREACANLKPLMVEISSELEDSTRQRIRAVELATLEWMAWFNTQRLLEPIGYIPPAEAEANYYRQLAEQTSPVVAEMA